MAIAVTYLWFRASRLRTPALLSIALAASGCSINLGSLTPSS
jgi:hypothetical protein